MNLLDFFTILKIYNLVLFMFQLHLLTLLFQNAFTVNVRIPKLLPTFPCSFLNSHHSVPTSSPKVLWDPSSGIRACFSARFPTGFYLFYAASLNTEPANWKHTQWYVCLGLNEISHVCYSVNFIPWDRYRRAEIEPGARRWELAQNTQCAVQS